MVRAEKAVSLARTSAIDERDLQVLLHLLEHKVLTTHQISSLHFRSLRRCQHRMRELKDPGLVSSFSVGRGFGEGRAPACWYLTKPGLAELADAKGVRVSGLPWVPDSSYRTNKLLAHRLGVNAFFCALAEASRSVQGHCLATWRPEHWVRTRAAEVKPDGFGRYLHRAGACEFYLEYDRATEASGALSRKLEGYLKLAAGWTREQELLGFPNLLVLVPEGSARGRSRRPFDLPSGPSTSPARSRVRFRCMSQARIIYSPSASSARRGSTCRPTVNASRLSTYRPGPAISSGRHAASAATSPMNTRGAASPPSRPRPDSAPCRPDMPREALARRRADRSRAPWSRGGGCRYHGCPTRTTGGSRRTNGARRDIGRC
jgi:Replication-relaxation